MGYRGRAWVLAALAALSAVALAATPARASSVLHGEQGTPLGEVEQRAISPEEEILADQMLDEALEVLRGHGYFPAHPVKLTILEDQGGKGDEVLGFVTRDDIPPNASPTCNLFLTQLWRGQDYDVRRQTVAHEAAHCAQHPFYSSVAQRNRMPKWVLEGTAEWLGSAVVEERGGPVKNVAWTPWLRNPKRDLFERDYDAVGFFAMIHQSRTDAWTRIKEVLQAAANRDEDAAYEAAIRGLPDIFFARWGPGFVRKAELGPEWDLKGPGLPDSRPSSATIRNDTRRNVTTEARGAAGGDLQIRADVLTVKTDRKTQGLLRDTNGQLYKLKTGSYCAMPGGCRCRTGRTAALPSVTREAFTGFGGDPRKARTVTFSGLSIRDWCRGRGPGAAGPARCPTDPFAAARQDDLECADPGPTPPGIQIYDEGPGDDVVLVATFAAGNCTAGEDFLAVSSDGVWELEVGISEFRGFDEEYPMIFGYPEPLVVINGPGGPYSNEAQAPSSDGPAPAGVIFIHPDGELGLGMPAAMTADSTNAVLAAGVMDCVYPSDR